MNSTELYNTKLLIFNKSIKVGDLVTSYTKGFSEVIKIEPRHATETPLVHYNQKFTEDGKPFKNKTIRHCDSSYCRKANEVIPSMINKKKKEIEMLTHILESLPKVYLHWEPLERGSSILVTMYNDYFIEHYTEGLDEFMVYRNNKTCCYRRIKSLQEATNLIDTL
jgi:hypothetical protein